MNDFLGNIFGEQVDKTNSIRKMHQDSEYFSQTNNRIWFFTLILFLLFGILATRLFHLTIIKGEHYRELSGENRIRETKIIASRGIIYDRNRKTLVRNIPAFLDPYGTLLFDKKATVSAEREQVAREYIYGATLAHVLGYTGEISAQEMTSINKSGDFIGKMGVEKSYDRELRGIDGRELIEVDATGANVRTLGRVEPRVGNNLYLNLDLGIAQLSAELMKDKKGAIIAANPINGELYVVYSSPSFDPNIFIKDSGIETVLVDVNQPLFNRAISGLYPPGSTFKIVTSIAGLESRKISSETRIEDTGILTVGAFSFSNWYFTTYGKKEGILDIVAAIKRSNDIFFYKAGELIGIDTLAKWARRVGVDSTLGIDIEGEEKGVMPDPTWQKEVKNENWYLGNTYHVAIGQGDILTTPLGVNSFTNIIANGGKLCIPHLINKKREYCSDLGIAENTINLIREGMIAACSPGGTGWPMFNFKIANSKLQIDEIDFLSTYESTTSSKPMVEIRTACKTGTAEYGDSSGKTHAWFTIFAPAYNPQISITVLIEGGGEGSTNAAPIAKRLLEEWFTY